MTETTTAAVQTPPPFIPPTVGRVVLYTRPKIGTDVLSAQIAKVNHDGTINIGFLGPDGRADFAVNVPLVQAGQTPPDGGRHYCQWMSYQVGQAQQTEQHANWANEIEAMKERVAQLEARLDASNEKTAADDVPPTE